VPGRAAADTEDVIDVRNLTKRYGQRTVLDGLTFSAAAGAVTGFLGPNGAGKSTTMRMILGLAAADAGEALIGGRRYRDLRFPLREVGALLEAAAPSRSMTVLGHLRWLARSNRIDGHRVGEVLRMTELDGAARQRAATLSLGMGQRLGLAAALLGDPPVLLLDEPVNGLDAEGIRWIRELLRAMAREGRTVLVSSHLMAELALTADHLVIINRGRLLAETSTAQFIERHAPSYVRVRTPRPDVLLRELTAKGLEPTLGVDGGLVVPGTTSAQVRAVAEAHRVPLDELSSQAGSLEDAFLGLLSADRRA
jgi:ABC-2 type transport system ATP-binding protein